MTPNEAEDLLGAWALGALDTADTAMVDRALADHPELGRELSSLCDVVAELGSLGAPIPPQGVRDRLLDTAKTLPPTGSEPTDPLELFERQVVTLSQLLSTLDEEDWARPAAPYAWTVHGLVGHLLVIDRYTAGQLGIGPSEPEDSPGHLEMGKVDIARELKRTGPETGASWHETALATISELRRRGDDVEDRSVEFHGWPFTVASLLVARAFEVWTHTDDIRRAAGRLEAAPPPEDLRTMSMLSVTSLPLVLPLVDPSVDDLNARIVLTGEGGGTFDLGDPEKRDTLIAADVVGYCRLAARRVEIGELPVTIEGDRRVAESLLMAARVFAV